MPELAHQVFGPRDGPAVLLVHGFPMDRQMWRLQVNALASAGLRVVVPDLAGFGRSEGMQDSIDGNARDLVALIDRLHIQKATVVGFSMGGYVALAFAAIAAARLDALVLIDTRAGADSQEGKSKRDALIAEVKAHGVRALAMKQVESQLTQTTRSSQRLLVDEVRMMMLRQPKAAVAGALKAMRDRPDRMELLPTIKVPALVLVGSEDKVTPVDAAQAMADALPDATLQVIEGAAHLSPMERPNAVNEALVDWLASP